MIFAYAAMEAKLTNLKDMGYSYSYSILLTTFKMDMKKMMVRGVTLVAALALLTSTASTVFAKGGGNPHKYTVDVSVNEESALTVDGYVMFDFSEEGRVKRNEEVAGVVRCIRGTGAYYTVYVKEVFRDAADGPSMYDKHYFSEGLISNWDLAPYAATSCEFNMILRKVKPSGVAVKSEVLTTLEFELE